MNYIDPSGNQYTDWDRAHGVNKSIIDKATAAYNKAKTQKQRNDAHKLAEKERNKHRSKDEVGLATGDTIRNAQYNAMTPKQQLAYRLNKESASIPGNSLKILTTGSNYGGYCPVTQREWQDAKEGVLVDIGTALVGGANKLTENLFKGGSKLIFKSTDNAASLVAKNLNGTLSELKNGYKVEIPNGNKPIVVRIMNEGSGGRSTPYYRVSIDGKGSLTLDGKLSNDRALTHIDMTDDYLNQITQMIKKYQGKW